MPPASNNGVDKAKAKAPELVALVKRDVSSLSDIDLNRLMEEAKQEASRRKRVGNPTLPQSGTNARSRWVGAITFLAVVCFLLFKAETSEIDTDIAEKETKIAPPGQKGAWLEDHTPVDDEKKKVLEEESKKSEEAKNNAADGEAEEKKQKPLEWALKKAEEEEKLAKESDMNFDTKNDSVEDTMQEDNPADQSATPAVFLSLDDLPTKAGDAAKSAAFKTNRRPQIKYHYKPRSALRDAAAKEELANKWGSWTLVDPKASERPKDDFPSQFPNRDISWDKFPPNAWQTDQDYLSKFLPEATSFVERAMEAMLGEYAWSKFDLPDKTLKERVNSGSFMVTILNMTTDNPAVGRGSYVGENLGGWMTQRYFDGLKRRLMHALITEDTYTICMGGHSAAAVSRPFSVCRNHFQQSYTLQFHRVMEPVFARLGVKLLSHNFGYGGLGTAQNALAAGDLYGREIDMLLWDTQMTEKSNEAYDLFVRQSYYSGNRIPVLLGGMPMALQKQALTFDAEVGMFGRGLEGVPITKDAVTANEVVWAARYLRCEGDIANLCKENEYNGTCWIERDDYTPTMPQNPAPGGRASWHPGHKFHALRGRIIAFSVLRALHQGLTEWQSSPEKRLPEEEWHVTSHYENIRTKLKNVKYEDNMCLKFPDLAPLYKVCNVTMSGVSEMTPRANPRESAVRNLMKPAFDGYLPDPEKNVYNPPDVFNPFIFPPEGEFDYLAIVENGIDFRPFISLDNSPLPPLYEATGNKLIPIGLDHVKPGLGWGADANANPDECDGTYDSFCGRGASNGCLLYAHNDHRGGMQFESFSGWGLFTVPNVKEGLILVRLEWWAKGGAIPKIREWTAENNGIDVGEKSRMLSTHTTDLSPKKSKHSSSRRRLGESRSDNSPSVFGHSERHLKGGVELCDAGLLEVAVNGNITSYDRAGLQSNMRIVNRVVHILTILDDEAVTNGETHDIEIGVRLSGCQFNNMFLLSGIYWA